MLKKLLLLAILPIALLTILALSTFYRLFISTRTPDIKNDVSTYYISEPDESEQFNMLGILANTDNYEKTKKEAFEFAMNDKQNYLLRLDAFRLCIQASIRTNDKDKQKTCYDEAIKLLGMAEDDEIKKNWEEYLIKVNNDVSIAEEWVDDGQR